MERGRDIFCNRTALFALAGSLTLAAACGSGGGYDCDRSPSGWSSNREAEVVVTECVKVSQEGPCAEYSATFRQCPDGDYPAGPPIKLPSGSLCHDWTLAYLPDNFPGDLASGMFVQPGRGNYPS